MQSLIHAEVPQRYWSGGQAVAVHVPGGVPGQSLLVEQGSPFCDPPTHLLQGSDTTQGSCGFGLPEVGVCNCRKVLFHDNSASILETGKLGGGQSVLGVLHPLATAYSPSSTVDPAETGGNVAGRHSSFTHRYGSLGAGGLFTQDPLLHLETAVQGSKSLQIAPWLIILL